MKKKHTLLRFLLGLFVGVILIFVTAFIVFPLPGQIPILMYHFIGSAEEAKTTGNVVTLETFQKQISFLKRFGYHVISIEDYDAIISGVKKPRGREIVITFDDGNVSVPKFAVPVLTQARFPATLFLISQYLSSGTYGSMNVDSALDLAKNPLIHLQAHSRTHPFLSQISDAAVPQEIAGSKSELEKSLHSQVNYFAYPYGDFDQRSMDAAKTAGFRLAFTTSPKKLKGFNPGPYCITRIKITENDSNLFVFWFKITDLYETFKMWRHQLYQKKALLANKTL